MLALLEPAAKHHFKENRHHPEHHPGGVSGMNLLDLVEMWIDWYCASQRHAGGSMARSIDVNEPRYGLSPQLARIFRNTLEDLEAGALSTNRSQEE
ncbi:MAG TPA: DUF5662 family protein, partial [Solirubrobacteraceae bacterium]|nr:DUF5662 family protein [Solirubrobacteraceae bacterium]